MPRTSGTETLLIFITDANATVDMHAYGGPGEYLTVLGILSSLAMEFTDLPEACKVLFQS